jgi:hypothetical protein
VPRPSRKVVADSHMDNAAVPRTLSLACPLALSNRSLLRPNASRKIVRVAQDAGSLIARRVGRVECALPD